MLSRRALLQAIRGVTSSSLSSKSERLMKDGGRESAALLANAKKIRRRPLKCFRLEQHHMGSFDTTSDEDDNSIALSSATTTPQQFHATLCRLIRQAERRVYLASLYIGPAANPVQSPAELELLQVLEQASKKQTVEMAILLDQNRALRRVACRNREETSFTTSAQACYEALHPKPQRNVEQASSNSPISDDHHSDYNDNRHLYLISVLPDFWQRVLPNPVNEAAGVFHLKLYLVDDALILSGANLSQEYFTTRHDRYLYLQCGANGLVDCYADLFQALCQYATVYHNHRGDNRTHHNVPRERRRVTSEQLMELVANVLTTADDNTINDDDEAFSECRDTTFTTTVAYAVPTFQAPLHFRQERYLRSDVEAIRDWIQASSSAGSTSSSTSTSKPSSSSIAVRVASAYLNPTRGFQNETLSSSSSSTANFVHYLTAGRVSHGFTKSPSSSATSSDGESESGGDTRNSSHPRRDWIPTLFDCTARTLVSESSSHRVSLWFYHRPGWTFHAKGLWLTSTSTNSLPSSSSSSSSSSLTISNDEVLLGVTHGSGNYGARSEYRDMESNLILLFPSQHTCTASSLATRHVEEWNAMCKFARSSSQEPAQEMSWLLRLVLPWVRSFF